MLRHTVNIQRKRRSTAAVNTHSRISAISIDELHLDRHTLTKTRRSELRVRIECHTLHRHHKIRRRRQSRSRRRGRRRTPTAATATRGSGRNNRGRGRCRPSPGLTGDAQLERVHIGAVTGAAAAGPHPHRHTPTNRRRAQLVQPHIAVGSGDRITGVDHALGGGAVHASDDRVAPAPPIKRPITALRAHIEPVNHRTVHRREHRIAHRHDHPVAISLRRHTRRAHPRVRQRARDERRHILTQHRITRREPVRARRAARSDTKLKGIRDRSFHTVRHNATRVSEMIQRPARTQDQITLHSAVLMEQARAGMAQEPDQSHRHLSTRDARIRPERHLRANQNVIASQRHDRVATLLVQTGDVSEVGGTRAARQIHPGHTSSPVQEQRHLRTRHLRPCIEPLRRPAPSDPIVRDAVDRSLSNQPPGVHEPGVTRGIAHTRREHRQHVGLRRAAAHRRGPSRSRHHNRTHQTNHQQHTPQQPPHATKRGFPTAATGHVHQPAPPPPAGRTHYQRQPTATSATTSYLSPGGTPPTRLELHNPNTTPASTHADPDSTSATPTTNIPPPPPARNRHFTQTVRFQRRRRSARRGLPRWEAGVRFPPGVAIRPVEEPHARGSQAPSPPPPPPPPRNLAAGRHGRRCPRPQPPSHQGGARPRLGGESGERGDRHSVGAGVGVTGGCHHEQPGERSGLGGVD